MDVSKSQIKLNFKFLLWISRKSLKNLKPNKAFIASLQKETIILSIFWFERIHFSIRFYYFNLCTNSYWNVYHKKCHSEFKTIQAIVAKAGSSFRIRVGRMELRISEQMRRRCAHAPMQCAVARGCDPRARVTDNCNYRICPCGPPWAPHW